MKRLSSTAVLRIVDGVAIVLAQAMQLARMRVSGTASSISRMLAQRDQAAAEAALLRRELDILLAQRESLPPHRRPDYKPEQRLAILQLMRLRGWSIPVVCKHFVLHPNTVRAWIKAIEGRGNEGLFRDAIVWNRIDDAVRWAVHEIRRLCPEPEVGTRTIARDMIRAGIQIDRSSIQRLLREPKPAGPTRCIPGSQKLPMEQPLGIQPHALLTPDERNDVWHMDLTSLRFLWWTFTVAAILDGCTRRLLALRVYAKTPRASQMAGLVRRLAPAVRPAAVHHHRVAVHGYIEAPKSGCPIMMQWTSTIRI